MKEVPSSPIRPTISVRPLPIRWLRLHSHGIYSAAPAPAPNPNLGLAPLPPVLRRPHPRSQIPHLACPRPPPPPPVAPPSPAVPVAQSPHRRSHSCLARACRPSRATRPPCCCCCYCRPPLVSGREWHGRRRHRWRHQGCVLVDLHQHDLVPRLHMLQVLSISLCRSVRALL